MITEDGVDAGWEEYFDYIFPDSLGSRNMQSNMRLLELAKKWSSNSGKDKNDGGNRTIDTVKNDIEAFNCSSIPDGSGSEDESEDEAFKGDSDSDLSYEDDEDNEEETSSPKKRKLEDEESAAKQLVLLLRGRC